MSKTRTKFGPSQCEMSPNSTSTLIKRSVLTPKGKNVAGIQHEVPTPGAPELERKRHRAEDKQADRNSRKKAKISTMTHNEQV